MDEFINIIEPIIAFIYEHEDVSYDTMQYIISNVLTENNINESNVDYESFLFSFYSHLYKFNQFL